MQGNVLIATLYTWRKISTLITGLIHSCNVYGHLLRERAGVGDATDERWFLILKEEGRKSIGLATARILPTTGIIFPPVVNDSFATGEINGSKKAECFF
ncbi:MAG: hypothetical protein D6748_11130 [Calditrichaeota bacterium]|nr:MAG: hypothetical protein D6748_11130 [Calditrichota bacterium]